MRNPLNRLVAMLGLVMLGVVGYQLVVGSIGIEDAAIRAGITFGAVLVVRRLGASGMAMLADSMDREAQRVSDS